MATGRGREGGSATSASAAILSSTFFVISGRAGAPSAVENLMPRYWGGLWLAVKLTAPAAPRRRISNARTGVGTGRADSSAWNPSASSTRAASAAKRPARKRVS